MKKLLWIVVGKGGWEGKGKDVNWLDKIPKSQFEWRRYMWLIVTSRYNNHHHTSAGEKKKSQDTPVGPAIHV